MAPILVIIGPSGSGKSSVVRELARRGAIHVHPTWTTRPRRVDEADGSLEHRFVTDEAFDRLSSTGFFLDTVEMFGLPFRYGLPPIDRTNGRVDTVMLRAPLVDLFAAHYPDHVVFQIEDAMNRTRARLLARGCATDDLNARLDDNQRELVAGRAIADEAFVNGGALYECVNAVATAVSQLGSASMLGVPA